MANYQKILSRIKISLLLLGISALILSGCSLPLGQGSVPTPTADLQFPTLEPTFTPGADNSGAQPTATQQLALPQATNTEIPAAPAATNTAAPAPTNTNVPTAVPPTAVPPTPIPGPAPVRIHFATGATAGVLDGTIGAGSLKNFIVGAAKGQPLIINTSSANNDVTMAVTGLSDGVTLLGAGQKVSSWQTMLTVTQDYLVQIIGGATTENFNLNINTPARVVFDPGAISANRNGSTPGGWTVSYILRASKGQKMSLNLGVTSGVAVLAVYGFQDGNPYLRYVVEQTSFTMILPATEDYIVQVVPKAGGVATYSLNIAIQ